MRDQGRLVEWFDEKGYGFIQPNDLTKDRVFLHIKDFSKPGPRPIIGCALEYTVTVDHRSRYRALNVIYLKANQIQKKHQQYQESKVTSYAPSRLKSMQILCVIYIILIVILVLVGLLKGSILLLLILINVITYWCYAQDKEAAQLGNRRIPEQSLHILSFLGGWPAAYLAQQKLRHKTQKQTFKKVYLCTIAFNILLIVWLISPLNNMLF